MPTFQTKITKAQFHQWYWQASNGLRQLGWVGVVGIGLWVFVLMYYFSVVQPAGSRLDELHAQAASLGKLTHAASGKSASVSEQLSAFHEFFPKSKQSPELLAKIYAAASRLGVSLGQGEYRMARDHSGKLLRYELNFPVRAEYFQIRKFLNQVLNDVPSASLDNVSFQRRRISDPVLDSQIKLTVYLEAD
jgi:hypothetical protein